jgi:hypothetical protein
MTKENTLRMRDRLIISNDKHDESTREIIASERKEMQHIDERGVG